MHFFSERQGKYSLHTYLVVKISGLPEFRSFGQKGKFSPFGFRFRLPKVKAEYGRNSSRNSRKALSCRKFNESHKSEHVRSKVRSILDEFELKNKVKIALRDNAANMVAAFPPELGIKGVGCLAHSLQLVVKEQIFSMVSVTSLLKKCRDLCSYANRSTKFNTVMRNQQFIQMGLSEANCLNLPHSDTETRWNSSYYMVEKIIKLKPALVSTLATDAGKDLKIEFLAKDWELMSQIKKLLAPFEKATKMLQYRDASISCFIPIIKTILTDLEDITDKDEGIKSMKRKLLVSMDSRFDHIEYQNDLAIATYLNPQYKGRFFKDSATIPRVRDILVDQIEARLKDEKGSKPDDSENTLNISDQSDCNNSNSFEKSMANIIQSQSKTQNDSIEDDLQFNIKRDLKKYESSKTLPFKNSPLSYWREEEFGKQKPWSKALASIAKIYLTAPPTSADVERLFSTVSEILNKRRNRLLPNNAEQLLFVHENIANVNYKW